MRSVEEVREQAERAYERGYPQWTADCVRRAMAGATGVGVDDAVGADSGGRSYSLQPPSEQAAGGSVAATKRWVAEWRTVSQSYDVAFEERAWSQLGHQRIPVRLRLHGVRELAAFVGKERHWEACERRAGELACIVWDAPNADGEACVAAAKACARKISAMDEADWGRTCKVLRWLAEHPEVEAYARELPIRGIDTKWIERRRSVVFVLAEALIGHEPRLLLKAPGQYRLRILDSGLAIELGGEFDDLALSQQQLDAMSVRPDNVVVCENLVSLMTLPALPRTMALCGSGYAATELAAVRWLADANVIYWGDLDADGLAILNGVRKYLPHVVSVMMNRETLLAHRDLCVPGVASRPGVLAYLTEEERAVLALLGEEGMPLRLEQERIPYAYACEKLRQAID